MIRFIVACTDRKRLAPVVRARSLPETDVSERAAIWVDLVRGAPAALPALELYQGDHWSVARSISHLTELWVVSAGYGLVPASTRMVPYGATFTGGHADTVTLASRGRKLSDERQTWWEGLRQHFGAERPTVSELCADGASVVVVATAPYLEAMAKEILEADHAGGSIVIASTSPAPAALEHLRLPASGRLRTVLGGSMQSVNVRLGRYVIEKLGPSSVTLEAARRVTAALIESSPELTVYEREQVSDQWVLAFIAESRSAEPDASHTRLLRQLRDAGRACEQRRFRSLFQSVVELE